MGFKHKIETAVESAGSKIGELSCKLIRALTYGDESKISDIEHNIKLLSLLKKQLNKYLSDTYTNDLKPFKTNYAISLAGETISICEEDTLNVSRNAFFDNTPGSLNKVWQTSFNPKTGKMIVMMYCYKFTSTTSLYHNYLTFYEIDSRNNTFIKLSGNLFTHHSSSAYSPTGFIYCSYNDKYYIFADGTLVEVDETFSNVIVRLSATAGRSWSGGDVNNEDHELYLIDSLGNRVDIYNLNTNTLGSPISLTATPYTCRYVPNYKKLFIVGSVKFDVMNTISRAVTNLINDANQQRITPQINSDGKVVAIMRNQSTTMTKVETWNPFSLILESSVDLTNAFADTGVIAATAGFVLDKSDNIFMFSSSSINSLMVFNKNAELQLSRSYFDTLFNSPSKTIHGELNLVNRTLYLPKTVAFANDREIYALKFEYDCDDRVDIVPDVCWTLDEEDVCSLIKKIEVIKARC